MRGSENICFVGVHIFKVAVRFPWSASISRRYLCSVTIGALASGILLFSERTGVWRKCNVKFFCEVRNSAGQWVLLLPGKTKSFVFPGKRRTDEINGSLTGLFQANRSDDIKPGSGIEKNKSTFRVNMYINTKIYSSTNYIESFKINT